MSGATAQLNDAFRAAPAAGTVFLTGGAIRGVPFQVAALAALAAVGSFTRFGSDNDPDGEHDFGAFQIGDQRLFWKIDVFADASLTAGGDPADEAAFRILTIMLASKY